MSSHTGTLVEIRLVGLSLSAYRDASQHHDELRREFSLIVQQVDAGESADVPARLVAVIGEINERFAAFGDQPQHELDASLARGDAHIDLLYRVPPEVGPAAAEFDSLLDEADAYCRDGDALLTLTAPPRVAAFRRWFLGEFVRQANGEAPTPWTEPEA